MDHHHHNFLFVLTLLLSCSNSESWTWFSSSSSQSMSEESPKTRDGSFSIEAFNDQKAIRLVENAKNGLTGKSPCWQSAYRRLFSGCSASLAVDEKRSRFAWHLSDCFQRDSGRASFPVCDENSPMNKCLKSLGDHDHKVYLEFYLETNSICNQLQAHTFKHETERLVNELKNSAHNAEEKLEIIGERTESLLQSSNQIHDSLGSIDLRTQRAAEKAVEVGERVETVLKRSGEVYAQALRIARSQSELEEGQAEMKKSLVEGLSTVQDSYGHLSREVGHLRSEAAEIEKEIGRVGQVVSSKMIHLQSKADEIGIVAGASLDKQQQLLDGQTTAIKDVQFLTRFQSEALEESRSTLQKLVEYGHKQQEELFQRQTKLQELHDHLMDKSKSILEAQESFESKQATMFVALEKLFALQSAMVLESRLIKAFLIYSMMIFVIYMFTSTKQTYSIRPWLYIGLCATLCVEVVILRFTKFEIEQQSCVINVLRSSFAVLALLQIIHSIATYRDYEVLNYKMLQTLIEKVNFMERREMCIESDSEISWPSWIEHELPEDVNESTDPDYRIEQVCENSSSRRYNLRKRIRP